MSIARLADLRNNGICLSVKWKQNLGINFPIISLSGGFQNIFWL